MNRSLFGKSLLCVLALLLMISLVLCGCGGEKSPTTEPASGATEATGTSEVGAPDPSDEREPADSQTGALEDATEGTEELQDPDREGLTQLFPTPPAITPDPEELDQYLLIEDRDNP